uniref:Retrovirus-related Pol polyprotein from transposon TNT 1-94 n=1 Tax=Tanacetum cinerariifolium TaxID=118510 RepID=A0A699IGS2_TANCI|nr:retrovirus-related Pol polyprotein from transposon TNT 1-94 [Tanacetum cinerariifolium]
MLDRTDCESWAQRIRLYCRGKENSVNILQSIDNGPYQMGTTRDTLGTADDGGVTLGIDRPRTYNDLDEHEKKRFDADIRAINIVLQGLSKDIYKLINHNTEAKAIWDNVKMLLSGSELTKKDHESQLYDEFERFKMIPGENITDYHVRFHKLVNDMRNIKMMMPNIQLNSKFMNNMTHEWDRGTLLRVQVHLGMVMHRKELEMLIRDKENRSSATSEQANTYDADVDDQPIHDMAQNDPNIFQADDYDAFDLDVDDEPTAQTIFMANLSSAVSPLQQAGPSNASILSEVLNLENAINHHEIPNKVQQTNVLDSDSADMGNSNVIPYEQYVKHNEESVVPSGASSVQYDDYILHENNAYVPDDSFITTLNIYKD